MKIRHIDTRPTEVGQAHEALGLPPVEQVIDRAHALLKVARGKITKTDWLLLVLALIFVVRFAWFAAG